MTDRPECSVDQCTKPARSGSATLCSMHYHRVYRHGAPDVVATNVRTAVGRRYRRVARPGHPLADRSGRLYEHRAVLYDAIGPGPHRCHWCGVALAWVSLSTTEEQLLHVDHLNSVGDDNRRENLVPSCLSCNTARGTQARHARLHAMGWWSAADTVAASSGRRPAMAPA